MALSAKYGRSALRLCAALVRDDRGVTLVEYGIALILAITVGVTLLATVASGVDSNTLEAADVMDNR